MNNSSSQVEQFLELKSQEILKYINSLIGNDLRGLIFPEEILSEVVFYFLKNPHNLDRSERDLFLAFLWKSKMTVMARAKQSRKQQKNLSPKTKEEVGNRFHERNVAPSPTLVIHRADKQSSIQKYIELLPRSEQKKALQLVRIEGHSYRKASEIMGKNIDAVEKLVNRALLNLYRIVRKRGGSKFATTGLTS